MRASTLKLGHYRNLAYLCRIFERENIRLKQAADKLKKAQEEK